MQFSNISLSLAEIIAFLGVTQCVYILVYMGFRSGKISLAALPMIYFAVLACALLSDAAWGHWTDYQEELKFWQWFFWFYGPPLSVLLIIQVSRITSMPARKDFFLLLLMPLAYSASYLFAISFGDCSEFGACPNVHSWLTISGVIIGGISLLTIWMKRDLLNRLNDMAGEKERFWLILSLVILNVALLTLMSAYIYDFVDINEVLLIRGILGTAIAYIAATSLFRIYPKAVPLQERGSKMLKASPAPLNEEEKEYVLAIDRLLTLDKVYQEPSYGRSHMASELKISESLLSRIINGHYGKNVPQLLNEYRVKEAEILLTQTEASISEISEEAGFNSLATFNRVFKEIRGITPSSYRAKKAS